MDIPREPPKKRKKYILGGIVIAAILILTAAVSRLQPAAPSVDRGTLWIDTVHKGEMVRQVRGPGTLVPEQIFWVSAVTGGRVEKIHIRPPATVTDTSTILEMTNPDVQLEMLSAEQAVSAAEAQLVTLKTTLETQRLNQESTVATAKADEQTAKRAADVAVSLGKQGLLSTKDVGDAMDKATESAARLKSQTQQLAVMSNSMQSQIQLQEQQVARLRAIATFQRGRVASMQVRAGANGVLQQMDLEPGQWVQAGTQLAKVAQPGKLKAVLRIPETQATDVQIGQPASIDTRNGIVQGHVMRIDPSAENGTVTVDVALEGPLPKGARPELSVDGTIEIERLKDVLYVGRPAYGQPQSTIGMFRVSPDWKEATRVNVKLGRASVNTIEILQGLNVNDHVIISDMSAYDSQNRVRLR